MKNRVLATAFWLATTTFVAYAAINVPDQFTTGNNSNYWALASTSELIGTHKQVATTNTLNNIPASLRTEGMTCWVVAESKDYRLVGGIDNTNWTEVTSGTGTNGVSSLNSATGAVSIVAGTNMQVTADTSAKTVTVGMGSTAAYNLTLISQVTAMVGANQVNVRDFGAVGDGVTDDTAAIQLAIDAVTNATGGTVYFPDGIYRLDGDYRDIPGIWGKAQLILPAIPECGSTVGCDQPYRTIKLKGLNSPSHSVDISTNGAILLSTKVPTENNCCILGFPSNVIAAPWGFAAINLHVESLIFRTGLDPKQNALDLGYFGHAIVNDVMIDTGVTHANLTNATTNFSYGIISPRKNNNAIISLREIDVMGFHTGALLSEHCGADNIRVWSCSVGFEIGESLQMVDIRHILALWCKTNLLANHTAPVVISEFEYEFAGFGRGPDWATNDTWGLYEPTANLTGSIIVRGTLTSAQVPFKRPMHPMSRLDVQDLRYDQYYLPVQVGGRPETYGWTDAFTGHTHYSIPGIFRRGGTAYGTDPVPSLTIVGDTNGIWFMSPGMGQFWGGVTSNGFSGNGAYITNAPYTILRATNVPTAGQILKFDGTNMYWAAP